MPILSYTFWHWPRRDVPLPSYERNLARFQGALSKSSPPGFVEALSFYVDALPWNSQEGDWFEDWYLIDDFRALGALNEAAVGESSLTEHDSIASIASGGAAGIYKLLRSNLDLEDVRMAAWIRKPDGMRYDALLQEIDRRTRGKRTLLWQRQMTLGPAPEFCLQSTRTIRLPDALQPVIRKMRIVSAPKVRERI